MKKSSIKRDFYILVICFIASRTIVKLLGVSFDEHAIFEYWQYLDVKSLSGNLLQSLWYQHSQPPVFNFMLGIFLKFSGSFYPVVLQLLLLSFSLCNSLLLFTILEYIIRNSRLPLIITIIYLLNPATILFENEFFYTSFISMLLLGSVYFMIKFFRDDRWKNAAGIFTPLVLVCLTKSMYHLLWLVSISVILLLVNHEKKGFKKLLLGAMLSIVVTGGWYAKNYLVFDTFSASSWSGMNFARIVFQNIQERDANNIGSVHPFMPISYYKNYISHDYQRKYAGINDRILLDETKNGQFINMNNAGYLQVSKKYWQAGKLQVTNDPVSYLKNVATAFIIYFTPASSYFKVADNNKRISFYDMLYSLNFSHLFDTEYQKKEALVFVAIPKFMLYVLVFFMVTIGAFRSKSITAANIFILSTIVFSVTVSSLFEYGENMRFRYEIEPLFLILLAHAITMVRFGTANFMNKTTDI